MMKKVSCFLVIACCGLTVAACGTLPSPRGPATSASAVVESKGPAKIEVSCLRNDGPTNKAPVTVLSGVLDNGLVDLGKVLGSGKDLRNELVRKDIGIVYSRNDDQFCRAAGLDGYECQCSTVDTLQSTTEVKPSK